jgi:hypothetical protein
VLDEPPLARDAPLVPPTVLKSILGQGVWQLGVMAALLGPLGDTLAAGDRGVQYTLLFNTFVLMQLFNQVGREEGGAGGWSEKKGGEGFSSSACPAGGSGGWTK